MNKYFAYIRKSTEGEERQALSIDSQRDKIREYFSDLVIIDWLEERYSAFKPGRPVFNEMIKRIEAGEADGIIAWHPDRMSRNEIDAANITYMIRTGHIKDLKFCSYNFDNSPEGIWMLQMALSQSQYDSAKKGRDVKRGMEKKVKMGWKPGIAPEGYLNDRTKERGEREVIADPDRFHLVKRMWEMILKEGYSAPKIREIANNEWGYRTVKRKHEGGGPLGYSTIYKMFTNPYYAGYFLYNGEMYKGNQPAMITMEDFEEVQRILKCPNKAKPKTRTFSFTGAIRCGECGCMVTAETKTKVIKSTGERKYYTYYHCTHRKDNYKCDQKSLIEGKMEEQIDDELAGITIMPEFQTWAIEVLNSQNDREITSRSAIFENQHRAIEDTQKQLDSLTQMRYRELIDDEEYLKDKNRLKAEIVKMKGLIGDTELRAEKWHELTEETFEFATYARYWFEHGDEHKKKQILLKLGSNPVLRDGKLLIEPYEWFVPIKNNYPELEREYLALEPVLANTSQDSIRTREEALASIRTRWLRRSDSNRRPRD